MRNHDPGAASRFPFAFVCALFFAACATTDNVVDKTASNVEAQPRADDPSFRPAPGDAPCTFEAIPESAWSDVRDGRVRVGDFELSVDRVADGGGVSVAHASEPSRVLFAAEPHRLVQAERGGFSAVDHQGSFTLSEQSGLACRLPHLVDSVASNGKLRLRGTFDDGDDACQSLRFTASMCQPRPGHLTLEVRVSDPSFTALTLETASDAFERIYGLGEQFRHDSLNLKGQRIPVLAQEGGVGRGHIPISPGVHLASTGSAGSENSTYYAAPHILTSRMRSLFLENTDLSIFDMTDAAAVRIKTFAPVVRARILYGRSPLELIERFTEYAGRMPELPEWVNQGAIVALARELDASVAIVDRMQRAGAAISAVWNQTWPGKARTFIGEQVLWNWAYNPAAHPNWAGYVSDLERRDVRVLCYVNPMFRAVPADARPVARDIFAEGLAQGAFVQNTRGSPYIIPVTAFDIAMLDVMKPSARTWMKAVLGDEMIDKARCSGWMADFGEALPLDAVLNSKVGGTAAHNAYPVEWMSINRELLEERGLVGKVLVWNRSGGTRTPSVSTLLWEGDQLTTWDKYDGMVSALHGLLNGGFSGLALNHSDTGGYTSLSAKGVGYDRERELLERWTEMNAFSAVLRTHEGNQPELDAQVYDDAGIAHFARMSKVYRALASYRRSLFAEATTRGWPVVRHLALHYPSDAESWRTDDELLLGSEILLAPVKNKCFTWSACPYDKNVYLPPGRWVHLWTGNTFGNSESSAQGTHVSVKAPLGKPAVFYRESSPVGLAFAANLRAAGVL